MNLEEPPWSTTSSTLWGSSSEWYYSRGDVISHLSSDSEWRHSRNAAKNYSPHWEGSEYLYWNLRSKAQRGRVMTIHTSITGEFPNILFE